MNRKISIITVVYNGETTLESTIKSVLALPEAVEFIIIDGGSKDNTTGIIQQYADRLHYWVSERDRGIYDAMNKGWEQASAGNYILFLGSGDTIVQLPKTDAYGERDVIFGDVHIDKGQVFKSVGDFRLKMGSTLHHQALLVNKSFHPAPPFSLDYKVYSDFDFNQRLKKKGYRFVHDPSFVATALPGGVSSRFNYKESLRIVVRNFGLGWSAMAIVYYGLLYVKWSLLAKK